MCFRILAASGSSEHEDKIINHYCVHARHPGWPRDKLDQPASVQNRQDNQAACDGSHGLVRGKGNDDRAQAYASERIVRLAAQHRLPAVYPFASFAEIGGLVSYGVNVPAMWRAAAGYIDRILRGSKPSELPVREPEEPEIVVNLKTVKALNLTIPSSLRSRITSQIE